MDAGSLRPGQPQRAEYVIHLAFFLNARHRVAFGAQVGPAHGHSWRVEIHLRTTFRDGPDQAPVQFAELERLVRDILRPYERQYLNDLSPFDRLPPTTENLARFVFGRVQQALAGTSVSVVQVTAWEAPTKGVTVASPLPEATPQAYPAADRAPEAQVACREAAPTLNGGPGRSAGTPQRKGPN